MCLLNRDGLPDHSPRSNPQPQELCWDRFRRGLAATVYSSSWKSGHRGFVVDRTADRNRPAEHHERVAVGSPIVASSIHSRVAQFLAGRCAARRWLNVATAAKRWFSRLPLSLRQGATIGSYPSERRTQAFRRVCLRTGQRQLRCSKLFVILENNGDQSASMSVH